MSNTRFKSMQNDLHTSLLHGKLSRLETGGGGGRRSGRWSFILLVFLPQSATHTVTQSADTAFAMRLERNEKPACASVKRANGGLSPSTKINCEQGRTWHRYVISYCISGGGGGAEDGGEGGEKVQCSLPASPRQVHSSFGLTPPPPTGRHYQLVAWKRAAMEDECGLVPPRNDVPDSLNVASGMFCPMWDVPFLFFFIL